MKGPTKGREAGWLAGWLATMVVAWQERAGFQRAAKKIAPNLDSVPQFLSVSLSLTRGLKASWGGSCSPSVHPLTPLGHGFRGGLRRARAITHASADPRAFAPSHLSLCSFCSRSPSLTEHPPKRLRLFLLLWTRDGGDWGTTRLEVLAHALREWTLWMEPSRSVPRGTSGR